MAPNQADNDRRWLAKRDQWQKLGPLARQMRWEPTEAELVLWRELRGGQLGARFRRQVCIGPFVVDFYCGRARLAVEVDGPVHQQQRQHDEARDAYLHRRGVTVVRFSNKEVLEDILGVLAGIRAALADAMCRRPLP